MEIKRIVLDLPAVLLTFHQNFEEGNKLIDDYLASIGVEPIKSMFFPIIVSKGGNIVITWVCERIVPLGTPILNKAVMYKEITNHNFLDVTFNEAEYQKMLNGSSEIFVDDYLKAHGLKLDSSYLFIEKTADVYHAYLAYK